MLGCGLVNYRLVFDQEMPAQRRASAAGPPPGVACEPTVSGKWRKEQSLVLPLTQGRADQPVMSEQSRVVQQGPPLAQGRADQPTTSGKRRSEQSRVAQQGPRKGEPISQQPRGSGDLSRVEGNADLVAGRDGEAIDHKGEEDVRLLIKSLITDLHHLYFT